MGGDRLDLGHVAVKPILDFRHIGDARHDDEALPAAMMLAQQCLAHHHVVPFHHIGAHREPVDRRGLDRGQLAQARHRHLQRARDRRGGQGEHVDIGAQRLELFLVHHAKALLLIDDNQPELLESDRFRQDRMGADDHVHCAIGKRFAGRLGFLFRHEPRQAAYPQRKSAKPLDKSRIVLASEQRRRSNNRDLMPAHRGYECGAQRDLGLAEADIAADQTVHRLALGKIGKDVLDGAFLILGLLPREAFGELVVGRTLALHHRRLPERTLGRGLHQFARDRLDALLEL